MSRKENCWDNAMEELQRDLFWYREIYYNGYRKHSANNGLSPKQKKSITVFLGESRILNSITNSKFKIDKA
jgi:hypothetical protein